jgi:hypothetical protein
MHALEICGVCVTKACLEAPQIGRLVLPRATTSLSFSLATGGTSNTPSLTLVHNLNGRSLAYCLLGGMSHGALDLSRGPWTWPVDEVQLRTRPTGPSNFPLGCGDKKSKGAHADTHRVAEAEPEADENIEECKQGKRSRYGRRPRALLGCLSVPSASSSRNT